MSTKQEVEKRLQKKATAGVTAGVVGSVFENEEAKRIMNSWMIGSHISWALVLAVTFVGLNYGMIWVTETFVIPPFDIFVVLTPPGAAYMAWQFFKFRRKPKTLITASA